MRAHRVVLTLTTALAVSPGYQPVTAAEVSAAGSQPATAAEVSAAGYQVSGPETFSQGELIASGHRFFGSASKGLAMTPESMGLARRG